MAKVRAKKGDSLVTVSKKNNIPLEDLRAVNPGVATLKPGQVIKVPKITYDDKELSSGRAVFNPAVNPVVSSQYLGAANILAGGQLSPDKNPVIQQPFVSSSSYTNPALVPSPPRANIPSNVINQGFEGNLYAPGATAPPNVPKPRPTREDGTTPVYTGNPNDPYTAQWIAYWNDMARNPQLYAVEKPPIVMTRAQIWEMKAEARRRRNAGLSQDEFAGGGGGSFVYADPNQVPQQWGGGDLLRPIVWSAGG